jgi:WD40 repeat protein
MEQLCIKDQIAVDTFTTFNSATLYTYCGHSLTKTTPVIAVAWSPDGTCLAVASYDGKIRVLQVE